jgi:hypothetical protein
MVSSAPTGGIDPESGIPDDAGRELFLRQLLERFEAGRMEPYEYTRRVMAINAATSVAQMAAVADEFPAADVGTAPSTAPALDAVDLALLHKHQQHAGRSEGPRTRYIALAVVFVLFAVLIGVGVWVASRAHAVSPTPGATIVSVLALALPW